MQIDAMNAIASYGFSDQDFFNMSDLFPYLQSQRRGFNFRSYGEDPKILSVILSRQKLLLNQLLNKNVLTRINNSTLYGNEYSLTRYMIDLRNAIFKTDLYSNVSTMRRNLQITYLKYLLNILSETSSYDNLSKSSAYYNVDWLYKNLDNSLGNLSTRQHRDYLLYMISEFKNN